jgi:hypothetical protein
MGYQLAIDDDPVRKTVKRFGYIGKFGLCCINWRRRNSLTDVADRFGVMTRIMTALAHELSIRGAIDVSEAFIDASFAPAKKGGAR